MRGFTLLETLVVLSLTIILSAIGIVQFAALNQDAENGTAIQLVFTDILRAKFEASAKGGRVIVKQSSAQTAYTAGIDYPPYSSTFVPDSSIYTRNLPKNMTIAIPTTLVFDPRGFLVDSSGNMTTGSATLSRNGVGVRTFAINGMGGVS